MRIIKFRAWDKKRKRMYEVNNIILNQYPDQTNPAVWAHLWGRDCIEQKDIILHAENIELMQFTGLLDKNGKEIYEGDIVEDKTSKYVIKFKEGRFLCFDGLDVKLATGQINHERDEVIGNKFENKELLGGKQDESN